MTDAQITPKAVERYDQEYLARVRRDDGPWVLAEDYDALAQQNAVLRAVREAGNERK